MKKYNFLFFLIVLSKVSFAQMNGTVSGLRDSILEPILGAKIYSAALKILTTTNESGFFEFTKSNRFPDTLIISATGYYLDTVIVQTKKEAHAMEVKLYALSTLPEIVIEMRRATQAISKLKTLHVEELTSGELRKAACCNLSESFETNASVDVNLTDAVTGAKKIQMMGLDGIYTQIQVENIPYLRGLESSFGLNTIPGTWIESIQITKGTGNVVNGYESMAGLINLELKKPKMMERMLLNGYINHFGRVEINANGSQKINKRWNSGLMVHGASMSNEVDMNKDGFRDLPLGHNLALSNRWSYFGQKMEAQLGLTSYIEDKKGGQLQSIFHPYQVNHTSKHIDMFAKTGFFTKKPYQSIGVIYQLKYHTVSALFGHREFQGQEKRGYVNLIYDGIIGSTNHKIKIGASTVLLGIRQQLDSIKSDRTEVVPGIFSEYTFVGTRLTSVWGVRLDHHNLFGFMFSPRIHSKLALSEKTDLRFTAGKGWHVPNYMIDNISLLASSKTWIVTSNVLPEISWNIGGSLVQEFELRGQKAHCTIDYYHTFFENQLIVDRDLNPTCFYFNNLKNGSFSNAFQVELDLSPFKNFEIRTAYKFLDVRALFAGKIQQQVMLPKNRIYLNLSYITRNKRWEYNGTLSYVGVSRLPNENLPQGFSGGQTQSQSYSILNFQMTHLFKKIELYLGGENMTNFKQNNPIVDASNPFGSFFDATSVWGPIMGIMIYGGFRYKIKNKIK